MYIIAFLLVVFFMFGILYTIGFIYGVYKGCKQNQRLNAEAEQAARMRKVNLL